MYCVPCFDVSYGSAYMALEVAESCAVVTIIKSNCEIMGNKSFHSR